MNRDPILIRVDATARTGYERLARCLTLAAALQRRRRPTYFLSQLEPGSLGLSIKRAGNDWLDAYHPAGSDDDLGDVLQEIRRLGPAAVIVDEADASPDYLREIASTGVLLVSIDHQANICFPSNLLVNPLLAPGRESYEFIPGTQLLLNQRYTLVRPEVRRLRQGRSQEPPAIVPANAKPGSQEYRAIVSLGDDDPHRKTIELAKLLLAAPRLAKVDVIVRREHPDLEKLQSFAAGEERLELALEPAEIAARILRAHFAITSGSSWSNELACVGIPQLIIVQNESHWPNAQRLEEEGCATCLGWHESVSAQTVRLAVQNILNDPLERQAMSRCGRQLIDGRGPDRFVTALELLLHPARRIDVAAEAA
ncbi:MAG: polysaccharide biosynthesis protein [Planctomycetes bacterium]|nr:polysaccharide biosynthesis protein [Planctomycetota bacterium]